jgi:hypothetical protein
MIDALLGGTEAMRAAGGIYLPKYERETQRHWEERLWRNVLTNYTDITSEHLTGQALKVPPEPDQDVPANVVELLEDVDGQGTGLVVFARKVFQDGINKAFTHVLVDYPSVSTFEGRTLEDDRSENLRPYWIHVPPENVIFAHSEVVDGKEVLTHVRIYEQTSHVVGWEETFVNQIRVLRRLPNDDGDVKVFYEIWEERKVKGNKTAWVQVDGGVMDIDEIPLVTFYTDRQGFMCGKPPLTDLAYLNVAHWQSSSDQRNVLTVSRFPMLAASGATDDGDEGQTQVGPHSFLYMPDPQGKFYYVEHSGKAIEAGRNDLKDLEEQMAGYGAEFMRKRPANEAASSRYLESAESLSTLQVWVLDFKDALENMLRLTGRWLGLEGDSGGSIVLETDDIGMSEADGKHLDALDKARARREISRAAYLYELKRRGVLSEDFDIEEDAELLEDEAPSPDLPGMFGQEQGPPEDDEGMDEDEGEGEGTDEGTDEG